MSVDPYDIRKHTDWTKWVLFAIAVVGFIAGFGEKIMNLGKTTASIEVSATKVDRLEATTNQLVVDVTRAKLQAEGANAAALRGEEKIDKIDAKVDHINDVLMQIRITGRR